MCCSVDRLALEKPVETAMLLSLAGVNSILTNQWHCSLHDNAEKLDTLMKGTAIHQVSKTPDILFQLFKKINYDQLKKLFFLSKYHGVQLCTDCIFKG